jgi:4-carboxymuconolactone decarboxylase
MLAMAISQEAQRVHNALFQNHKSTLLSVITQLLPFIGYPRTLNAIRIINEGTAP